MDIRIFACLYIFSKLFTHACALCLTLHTEHITLLEDFTANQGMEHPAKISLINGLAAVMTTLCFFNGYYWVLALNVFCCVLMGFYWKTLFLRQVIVSSQFLGAVFAIGFIVVYSFNSITTLGLYMMAMSIFHFSEFHLTAIYNSGTLSFDSFLLNHSREYGIAAVASWMEYLVEYMIYPDMKALSLLSLVGLMLVVSGELMRKAAMVTAGSNFTHEVAHRKRYKHELVTTGVYGWFRHPSYVGWFYWSIGTQLLLCNPVCIIGYALATWRFFEERIYYEEQMLLAFFGHQYKEYKKKVWTGLPGISGYPVIERITHSTSTNK